MKVYMDLCDIPMGDLCTPDIPLEKFLDSIRGYVMEYAKSKLEWGDPIVHFSPGYGEESDIFTVQVSRPETKAETEKRLDREQRRRARKREAKEQQIAALEERERKLLEKLKRKYEELKEG